MAQTLVFSGARLRAARVRAGLGLPDVANHFRRAPITVADWESRPDRQPPVQVIAALAVLLKCDIGDLFTDGTI